VKSVRVVGINASVVESDSSSSKGMESWVLAVIIVGGVLVVAAIAGLIIGIAACTKHKKKNSSSKDIELQES